MKKNTRARLIGITLSVGTLIALSQPAQARFDYDNWQPVLGSAHNYENALEVRLNRDYDNGVIDTNELAMLRRDLDGIEAQEDEFRMDHNGLGIHDRKCMANKLITFEQKLSRAESDKFGQTIAQRQINNRVITQDKQLKKGFLPKVSLF